MQLTHQKVLVFITREHDGNTQLLVCFQPARAEEGFQALAGNVEPGELAEECVQREIYEETGLEGLPVVARLGSEELPEEDALRHVFQVQTVLDLPDAWTHEGSGSGEDAGRVFVYRFHDLDKLPELRPDHAHWLSSLHQVGTPGEFMPVMPG